jgi:hypothetical protein
MGIKTPELREITWILAIKVLALFLIWFVWFSNPAPIHTGSDFFTHHTSQR